MIINYGVDPDVIPFIRCNDFMHDNKDHPVYMQPKYIGTSQGTQIYSLTPYQTQETQTLQEVHQTVKKGLFGHKVLKRLVSVAEFEPVKDSKGFSFVSTENRNLTKTLCFIPYQDASYKVKLYQYKKNRLVDPSPSVASQNKASYVLAKIGIDPELLMPILSTQPKGLNDAIKLVHTDPRFLKQIDPNICKSDEELELLYSEAKKGYNMIMDYQSNFGIDAPEAGSVEAKERQDYKNVCESYAKHFAAAYLTNKEQQNTSENPNLFHNN